METIKGIVIRILFSNQDTGYKVLKIRAINGKYAIVTGEFGPEIIQETAADFHGDYKTHTKYGVNFRAQSYNITYNAAALSSIKLFIDNIAPNIGPERAEAIVNHFRGDTIRVLDEEPNRLSEVEGIGKISSESLAAAWKENRQKWNEEQQIYSLRSFLNSLGIKERRVRKILAHFGGGLDAEEVIRKNPYILTEIEGFGFTTTDHIAKNLGIEESDPERFRAFVMCLLEVICPFYGHLYLDTKTILSLTNKYGVDNGTSFLGVGSIDESLLKPVLNELKIDGKIIFEDGTIYHQKYFQYESKSASILSEVMGKKSDLIFLTPESIEDYIAQFERENQITLSEEQKEALYFFAEKKVFVITGCPGTGKTTLLKAIVGLAKKLHLHLTCMTPTGISAKKLSETVNHEAYTIHRRLGYRGNLWSNNELNPYKTDVAIVDETSMVDMEVFYRLLSALERRTHLVFVGDHYQLPSVGAGNVLKELINSGEIPVIRLEKIFRQAEASDIIKAAHKIKQGDTNLDFFSPDPKSDIFFIRMSDPREIEKIIIKLATKFKSEKRSFQIITPRNDGPLGVNPLNNILQDVLNPPSPSLNEMKLYDFILRKGDRVIVRKNDYQNNIFNGDIGKAVFVGAGAVCVEIDDRIVNLPAIEVEEKIKLAYSISVHKSQGLEYPYIILPMINQFGKMLLQRNLLYTAITRAKEKVIVLGHGSAIEKAINNASVSKRNTKLGERIKKCLQQKKNDSSLPLLLEPKNSQGVGTKKEPSLSEIEEYFPTAITEKS